MMDEKQHAKTEPDEPSRLDRVSARQGEERNIVRWVLLASLTLVLIAMAVWLIYFI